MNYDWMEAALEAWGTWRGTVGMAQGWGGAGNAAAEHAGWAAPAAGVYSDPVLAEFIRAQAQHAQSATIDRLLTDFPEKDRQVMFLRYVGEKREKTAKTLISKERLQIGGGSGGGGEPKGVFAEVKFTAELPLHWEYSGKLPYVAVAEHVGVSEDAAARVVARIKKALRMQLVMMAKIRRGAAGEARRAA